MQRALSIAELRYLICAQATDHTLVQLAQCCKIFHEPAIRVLWSTIPDISPLVRCFPQDAWTVIPNSRVGDSIKLVRSLAPQDWTAFLKYSDLVRKLGTPPSSKPEDHRDGRSLRLDQRVLWELSMCRPVFVLFPNLATFEWSGAQFPEEDLPVVLGLLNSNLARANIHIAEPHHDPGHLRTSLSLIANRFTSLKDLRLTRNRYHSGDDLLLMPSMLTLVQSLPALEAFRCFYIPVTKEIFVALASLQNLTMFVIRLSQTSAWSKVNLQPDCFPKLEKMVISSGLQDYITFSRLAPFPNVSVARILFTDIANENDVPLIFTSISSQFSPSALSELFVATHDSHETRRLFQQSSAVIRPDHLRSLFTFANLTIFKFFLASRYVLDVAAYLSIAQAWPQIKTLEFAHGRLCLHPEPLPMREVLVPFAVHCPKLTRLSVRFDGSNVQTLASGGIENPIPQRTSSTSVVTTLDCYGSPVAEAPRVAAFLALLFPKLKELSWKKPADDTVQPGRSWREVQQYLPLFATIREDERRREAER